MSFTSPDLVRAHIANASFGDADVRNAPVILSGTSPSALPHAGLKAGSVTAKARRGSDPVRLSATLDNVWVILDHAQLMEDSVVVATDSSLGVIYIENVDYTVDYDNGRIKRIDTGTILSGQSIVVWYAHYHIYTEGDDFTVNYTSGQLTRRSNGDIADGQQVIVDYTVALGAVSDDLINQAISESGEAVLTLVSEPYHDSPSPGLVIGATHMAVAQLARMRAASVLADSTINSAIARAASQTWLEIATQYDRSAHTFLARYANPVTQRTVLRRG